MKPTGPIRVLCADDQPTVRKGIASILASEPDIKLVGEATGGQEAVLLFRLRRPDITLIELRMPGFDGIQATRAILNDTPTAKVIALTNQGGDQDIQRALQAGVKGYLLKEAAHTQILQAIRAVHSGKQYIPPEVATRLSEYRLQLALTPREIEVLEFAAQGMSNQEIGERLGTARGTVKMQIQHVLSKLGAADRTHAVIIAMQRGILHLDTICRKAVVKSAS